jgi:hypothetical protein
MIPIFQTAAPTPTSLSLRIAALEARIQFLEQRLALMSGHGAAPWSPPYYTVTCETSSPHWVLGEDGASAPEGAYPVGTN